MTNSDPSRKAALARKQNPSKKGFTMALRVKLILTIGLLLSLGLGCTLIAEVDRSKIGAGGAGGEGGDSSGK
jgi:hypothetical protein